MDCENPCRPVRVPGPVEIAERLDRMRLEASTGGVSRDEFDEAVQEILLGLSGERELS